MKRILILTILLLLVVPLTGWSQGTYLTQHAVAQDADFRNRVKTAIVEAAIAIANEHPNTVNHAKRLTYSIQVVANPDGYATLLVYGVVADSTITLASTDLVIKNRVAAIWNAYAGQ